MVEIVGVKFRSCGQVHFYKSGKYNLKKGDHCWAETPRGSSMGVVVMATTKAYPSIVPDKMLKIIAIEEHPEQNKPESPVDEAREAFQICQELIIKHELGMKLVKCSFMNDGKKVVFFFTAEGRVDFRELLKDLTREFKIRIELRQIGVRDEAKILGGLGTCGRTLCCSTWIDDFKPVSIKMAKQQNLSLDPQKISGICGRLKCCLSYEASEDLLRGCQNQSNDSEASKKGIQDYQESCPFPGPYDPPL